MNGREAELGDGRRWWHWDSEGLSIPGLSRGVAGRVLGCGGGAELGVGWELEL